MPDLVDPWALPTVLAGPQVRRLTRREVSVWVALKDASVPRLHVREVGTTPTSVVDAVTGESHVRVGEHLWLSVLTATGPGSGRFEPGVTYEYFLTDSSNDVLDEPAFWQSELSHDGFHNPTFVGLPDQVADFRLTHGSCRLPHAPGPDGLARAGRLANAGDRPHVLLLSGDQIYADDVSDVLFPLIREVSAKIINRDESDLPTPGLIGNRQQRCEEMGFTSTTARNHLWSLGEYLAMYLLTWSEALWPTSLPNFDAYRDMIPDPHENADLWEEHRAALETYAAELADVRRFLANVPTLMIFDDHEVTDDWNIDRAWCSHERDVTSLAGAYIDDGSGPAAPEVVANALLAYLLCQHWGNVPERFASGSGRPERTVVDLLGWVSPADARPADETMRRRLGIPSPPDAATPLMLWDETMPDRIHYHFGWGWDAADTQRVPLHVFFLDERTARYLEPEQPPQRIATTVIDQMLPPLPAEAAGVLVVVVAPGPVVGLSVVEHLVQPAVSLVSREEADAEAWEMNGEAHVTLLDHLAVYDNLVVLSGDVHYGYAWRVEQSGPGVATRTFAQLTCSGFHKADQLTTTMHWLGETMMQLGLVRDRTYRVYETEQIALAGPPPAGASLPWDDIVDVAAGRWARAAHESPTLVPEDIAVAYGLDPVVKTISVHPLSEPPVVTADKQAAMARQPWSGWDPEDSLATVASLRDMLLHRHGQVLTGVPQAAFVRFSEPTGGVEVTQTIHYTLGPGLNGTTVTSTVVGAP